MILLIFFVELKKIMALQNSDMDTFQKDVQKFIIVDKEYEKYQSHVKLLRSKRNEFHDKITATMLKNNWTDSILDAGTCRLTLGEKKQYSSLSFGYIEKSLGEIIHNRDHVDKIMKHLKEGREQKTQYELKKI